MVMGTGTAYLEQVQRITNRHYLSLTGTAHPEQTQRITKRHSFVNGKIRCKRPFLANFNFYLTKVARFQPFFSHCSTNRTCRKKEHPSTMNHFRTRLQPEKAAYTHFYRCINAQSTCQSVLTINN